MLKLCSFYEYMVVGISSIFTPSPSTSVTDRVLPEISQSKYSLCVVKIQLKLCLYVSLNSWLMRKITKERDRVKSFFK